MPTPPSTVRALVLDRSDAGPGRGARTLAVERLPRADFPPGALGVAVEYSSINYKDALILAERGYSAQRYPMVPGIDLAGTVESSDVPDLRPGDRIVLNGAGLGETRWGGYAEWASVDAGAVVRLSDTLSTRDAMALGTAGLAAALSVLALERHGLAPGAGDVLVTGAAGGVGSIAVALLAARGHRVVASAGHEASHAHLRALGAAEAIGRLPSDDGPALRDARWAAAVDTVGGAPLARVLAGIAYGGAVATTGFVAGFEVPLHLAPFLLRSVNLLGVNTSACPRPLRQAAWELLAECAPRRLIGDDQTTTVSLDDVPRVAEAMLAGEVHGRVVVDVRGGRSAS